MDKRRLILAAVAIATLGATAAHATTRDVYTDGSSAMGARNPYTDGGLAGRFDVYSDGAKIGDKRTPFTDGAKIGMFDPYVDGLHASMQDRAR